jgi:hypothetical protein
MKKLRADSLEFSGKIDFIEINESHYEQTEKGVESSHDYTAEKADDLKKHIPDLAMDGHPDMMFLLLSRLSTKIQNWTSRVYALPIDGFGVLLQHVFEHNGRPVSQIVPIPGGRIVRDEQGLKVVGPNLEETFCGTLK